MVFASGREVSLATAQFRGDFMGGWWFSLAVGRFRRCRVVLVTSKFVVDMGLVTTRLSTVVSLCAKEKRGAYLGPA